MVLLSSSNRRRSILRDSATAPLHGASARTHSPSCLISEHRDQQPHTTRKLSNVQAEPQQPLSNPQQSSGKVSSPVASPPSPPPPTPTAPASPPTDSNSIIVEFAPLEGAAQADVAAAKIRAASSATPRLARVNARSAAPQPPPVLTLLRTMFAGRRSQEEADTQLTLDDADDNLYGHLRSSGLQGFNFTLLELGSDGKLLSLAIARDHPHSTVVSIDGMLFSSQLSVSSKISFHFLRHSYSYIVDTHDTRARAVVYT